MSTLMGDCCAHVLFWYLRAYATCSSEAVLPSVRPAHRLSPCEHSL